MGKRYQGFKTVSLNTFKTQSVPAGRVVFQETFTKGNAPFETFRQFNVNDTTQYYTLHVKSQNITSAEVNLNGFDWITSDDFKGKKNQELSKDTLLLPKNNSLRVTIHGHTPATLTVTLVEGGSPDLIQRITD
mgnify:FL=1